MKKKFINAPEIQPLKRADHAVKVGNTIYTAGIGGVRDTAGNLVGGDIETQTERCFERMRYVLEAAGASFSDVVFITAYLTDINNIPKYQEVRSRYMKDGCFTGMNIHVASLPLPEILIEITTIAVID